jgi:hypothetical protein
MPGFIAEYDIVGNISGKWIRTVFLTGVSRTIKGIQGDLLP